MSEAVVPSAREELDRQPGDGPEAELPRVALSGGPAGGYAAVAIGRWWRAARAL